MANRSYDRESEPYGRRSYEDYDPERRSGRREERGFRERAGDELRSWFGDEEAERRRRLEQERYGRGYYDRDYDRYGSRESEYGRGLRSQRGEYGGRGYEGERSGQYGERGYEDERSGQYGGRGYESGAGWNYPGSGGYGSQGYGGQGYGGQGYPQGREYGQGYGYGGPAYGQTGYGGREQEPWQGQYVGRGPQSYKRSDSRIEEDINERLTQHGAIDAEQIQVSVKDGEVTLSGAINSRMEKRLAEDVAESCWGVRQVHNQLRVQQQQWTQSAQPASQPDSPAPGAPQRRSAAR
jgi:osmotically-inducible protein OsmY